MHLWTPRYEPNTGGGSIRVLDRKGRTVAKVGEKVLVGGGALDRETLGEHDFMEERKMRKLFERCSGNDYWMVADGDVRLL